MTNAEMFKKVFGMEVNPDCTVCSILSCKKCGRHDSACVYGFENFWNKEYKATNEEDGLYNQGLNDGWELARKVVINNVEKDDFNTIDIFGKGIYKTFKTVPVGEVQAKIQEYEEEQKNKLEVGDEVIVYIYDATDKEVEEICIVTAIDEDLNFVNILDKKGNTGCTSKDLLKKTGRHFPQIAEVLEQMGG